MGAAGAEWPDQFDPTLFSMIGNIFALIIFSVFGVLAMSREYSGGMIRVTLTATDAAAGVSKTYYTTGASPAVPTSETSRMPHR